MLLIFIRELQKAPVAVLMLAADLPWREEFLRNDAYNELLRPQKLQNGALTPLVREADHFVALSLM